MVSTDQTPILSFAHLTRRLSGPDTATDRVEAAPIPPPLEKREREYPRPLKRTAPCCLHEARTGVPVLQPVVAVHRTAAADGDTETERKQLAVLVHYGGCFECVTPQRLQRKRSNGVSAGRAMINAGRLMGRLQLHQHRTHYHDHSDCPCSSRATHTV